MASAGWRKLEGKASVRGVEKQRERPKDRPSQVDNDKTQSNLDIDLDSVWQICFSLLEHTHTLDFLAFLDFPDFPDFPLLFSIDKSPCNCTMIDTPCEAGETLCGVNAALAYY